MIIATLAPYTRHNGFVASHPLIEQLRFNTVMPIGEPKEEVVKRLLKLCNGKPLWLDLKTRQLRITKFSYLPYSLIELSHKIKLNLPAKILFKDCEGEIAKVVDGNKLILVDRPERVVGEGEAVNIPFIEIEGFFTLKDLEYLQTAQKLNNHNYMLSFVEQESDIAETIAVDKEAVIICKIESEKGLRFVNDIYPKYHSKVRLMAALDDLYINIGYHKILDAVKLIIKSDDTAIAASRIMTSLESSPRISMQDISQIELLKLLGYKHFMLSDGLCFHEEVFRNAMTILEDSK